MKQKRIGIIQIDGKLPNMALMKLAAYHLNRGDHVERWLGPLFHAMYDKVYASKIFKFSNMPVLPDDVEVGGSGINWNQRLPKEIDETDPAPGWILYNDYMHHIGFSEVGCRFKCGFCCVPQKDGTPRGNGPIASLLTNPRGEDRLNLMDDDFFGQKEWEDKCKEILDLNLRICFSQGLNIRIITEKQAEYLARMDFWALRFRSKKVTFAWDQFRDGKIVKRGFDRVVAAGIKPSCMQFFVLIGYDTTPAQDMERVMKIVEWGARPYVMKYDTKSQYCKDFFIWVNSMAYTVSPWKDYSYQGHLASVKSEKVRDIYTNAMWDE